MNGQFELFVVNGSPSGHLRFGANYAMVPSMGVAAVTLFWDPSCRTRSSLPSQLAATLVVDTIVSNCCHRAEGVSVRVLQQESERRDVYSAERLTGSVRLAHWRVQEESNHDGAGAIVAFWAGAAALTVVDVGTAVSLHRVRQGSIQRLAGHDPRADLSSEKEFPCGLGGSGDVQLGLWKEQLVHRDVLVISPWPGSQLASHFAYERLDFNRALVAAQREAADLGFFQGVVARWWAPEVAR